MKKIPGEGQDKHSIKLNADKFRFHSSQLTETSKGENIQIASE
jgi:hypothetical protein